jgi:hypothetical protein
MVSIDVKVEIFENQRRRRGAWFADVKRPWADPRNLEVFAAPENFQLPSIGAWSWTSNWKLSFLTDSFYDGGGWEYA